MYNNKTILLILSASLIEAVNWGNKICLFIIKYFTLLFTVIRDKLNKLLRWHFALIKHEIRKTKFKKTNANNSSTAVPVQKRAAFPVVGGSKTVFISELPNPGEPQPIETIELSLVEPEKPEELPYPDSDDFEGETDRATREEAEESLREELYMNQNFGDLPEENIGGATIEEMEEAYKVIHEDLTVKEQTEQTVAKVLKCLSGTDMFEMLINSEKSEIKAKEIMDRHFEKFHRPRTQKEKSKFNIGQFIE